MKSVRLTVGQAIVRYLSAQFSERDGVEQRLVPAFWAILGHGNVTGLGQALQELGPQVDLPTYRPQNEQAMVHAAAAFAKHRDRLATFACTASIGPGSSNMLTAAAGATINRLPVLLFPSDYFANRLPDPVLQQLEHQSQHDVSVNDAFRPLSRFFTRISRPEQLLSALPAALRVLTDPAETGAVTVALPEDVQTEAFEWPVEFFEKRVWRVRRPAAEPELLGEAARLLMDSERPLIVAGGGAIYSAAGGVLGELASTYGIPVCETQAGKGVIPWNHPMNSGPVGANGGSAANRLARDADLVIAVGTRLGDFATASKTAFQNPQARFVSVNVAASDAHKLGSLPLLADARRAIEQLREVLEREGYEGTSAAYRKELEALQREWHGTVDDLRRVRDPGKLAQSEVIGLVNEAVGGKATVVCAAGSMPGDLLKLWRPEDEKAYHLEYGYSCMGYEIPAGLGIKLAEPERQVVVFIGDGSYLMMNSEIVTAVAEGLSLTIVLVDNNGFQSIHGLQRASGTPSFVNELRFREPDGELDGPYVPVDFAQHARSMGALAQVAGSESDLRRSLQEAAKGEGVRVIVVPTDPERRVPGFEGWLDVPIAEASEQESVTQAKEEYDRGREKQRHF